MAPNALTSSKPNIELAHMKGSVEEENDTYLAKCERDSILADAEAFHRRTQGIDEPTKIAARRYLATKYPSHYPQWMNLVEAKGTGKASATQNGQSVRRGTSKSKRIPNTMEDSREGRNRSASRRGRGRGSHATARGRSVGLVQDFRQPTPRLPSGTSKHVVQTRGHVGLFALQGRERATPPARRNRELKPFSTAPEPADFAYRSPANTAEEVFATELSASSSQFKTYEEWHADDTRRQRKLEEEEVAKLLEDNEKAMQIDLPCDVESLSSISTEPASDHNDSLPYSRILEPIRKTPTSVISSSATSFARPPNLTNNLPTMYQVLEPIKIVSKETAEVKELSPVSFGSDDEEQKGLIPDLPTSSGFQAPDWRARSESLARKPKKEHGDSGEAENVDKIIAEWDRALLEL